MAQKCMFIYSFRFNKFLLENTFIRCFEYFPEIMNSYRITDVWLVVIKIVIIIVNDNILNNFINM